MMELTTAPPGFGGTRASGLLAWETRPMDQPENDAHAAPDAPEFTARRPSWLCWLALLVASACLFAISDTIADPDLWGHLTFGHDILQAGRLIEQDRYSYLSDRH